jgi:D-alanyl-D-alanine carboxypeptidase/D-alanyl-D-alanine-endopeptidase (penicillin-binding protein 4)
MKSFRITFHIIFIVILFTCLGYSQDKLISNINEVLADSFFTRTNIAIDIYDLTDQKSLFKENEKLLLTPASNQKILTTCAALQFLGSYYKFETRLFHTGIIEDGILYGDLYAIGGFDPMFKYSDLDSLLLPLKDLGIKKITGNIFGDVSLKDSLYWGKGWMWDDNPDPTAVYLSSLNINENSVEVFVEGAVIDSSALVTLNSPVGYFHIINNSKTVEKNNDDEKFEVTRDWMKNPKNILVDGFVPLGKLYDEEESTETLNIENPAEYFLFLLTQKLKEMEIQFAGKYAFDNLPENSVYLNSVYRPIDSVVVYTNKESDNLGAEMLLYALAFNDSSALATRENGLEAVERFIDSIGFNSENYSIADGSGVSRYNLVSAELLVECLKYFYYRNPGLFNILYSSFPTGGVDGTLKKRFIGTNVFNNIHAKTGTLSGVSALSGYITSANQHMLAFSILMENYTEKSKYARTFIDRICELLAEYK